METILIVESCNIIRAQSREPKVNYLRFNFKETTEVNCIQFEALNTAPASVDIYISYNDGSNADGSIKYEEHWHFYGLSR